MKTLILFSIIAIIGVLSTTLVFVYQEIQNCKVENGTIAGFLQCSKSDYDLMRELFQQKYGPVRGFVIDGVPSTVELTASDVNGNSITLTIKEGKNGPYRAELICENKALGTTKIQFEDINRYLQQEDCFSTPDRETISKLLTLNHIEHIQDNLIVSSGPVTGGDPRCGVVVDSNSAIHWFTVDSISKPQKMIIFPENPHQCQVNTTSCFCNAQMVLTAMTLDDLSYFTPEEEKKFANILIDYLGKENINRTPKFLIGKFNLNYTDPLAVGYCGELWGDNTYDYFEGAIVNDQVKDYGLEGELSPLCAINKDAEWWEKNCYTWISTGNISCFR